MKWGSAIQELMRQHLTKQRTKGLANAALATAATLVLLGGAVPALAVEFEKPVRLQAAGNTIRTESPGYAAPCLADIDKDGEKDLLLGQFRRGKIQIFKGLGKGTFAAGSWLQAEGADAEVPGVY